MSFENAVPVPPVTTPASTSDKALIILSHLSVFVGAPFLLPFIVWLVKKSDPDVVGRHAAEVLNFHLSWLIYSLCALPLCLVWIGFPILCLLGISALILAIVGAVRAADGVLYRYPLTIRFLD